jgi:hypothetical protein
MKLINATTNKVIEVPRAYEGLVGHELFAYEIPQAEMERLEEVQNWLLNQYAPGEYIDVLEW